ncbi:MAG: glycine C-acetyltransferase [Myxococcota bacterium]|jgi:glycine C-acetyltransferase|nr:glycine C-acetyltransferase [Myxococcota bacterium]
MYGKLKDFIAQELTSIRSEGLLKEERVITTPQGAGIQVQGGVEVINFCANNYLGLSSHPDLLAAARRGLGERGYGMSSVRFICGTQDIHKELERTIADFLGLGDTILYSSCFDANGGIFETLCKEQDAIVSDELNHASIIDGVRLSKAMRKRYRNNDLADLEEQLRAARGEGARFVLIVTDGVFSMDGTLARLGGICDLAERYEAQVMVDDSHATGFMGPTGRGTHEHAGVMGRVDIVSSTLGKAMGGASGGFIAARQEIVDLLRQRSRPYLFSNSLPPVIVAAALEAFRMVGRTTELRDRLEANTRRFREAMAAAGFQIPAGVHPICPIMLGDARLAQEMARDLLAEGIYVIGFSYPVVPKGRARIRVQISAGHSTAQIDQAVAAFTRVGRRHGVVS